MIASELAVPRLLRLWLDRNAMLQTLQRTSRHLLPAGDALLEHFFVADDLAERQTSPLGPTLLVNDEHEFAGILGGDERQHRIAQTGASGAREQPLGVHVGPNQLGQ